MRFLQKHLSLSVFMIILTFCACSGPSDAPDRSPDQIHVAEGYSVEIVAGPDLVDYPMFATLDETGRLFVFESIGNVYKKSQEAIDHPQFRIKLLQDIDGDGKYDKSTVFADSLSFPQGGVFYQGSLIASSAPDLLKLTDTDNDGVADKREVLLSGWVLNVNANSLIGPFMGPDGWLYMTSAIEGFDVTSKEGEHLKGETARIWRVRPDGSDLEWLSAGGMNNPVELTFTGASEVIGTQTFFVDPQRGLRDAITYWMKGGVYGKKSGNITRDGLPLTGDLMPVVTSYSRVAPAGIGRYRSEVLGPDFRDNLFTTQFNTHAVLRHQLFREGGTFRTEDEKFFWSENEDFHPTDVLEDADGSLMVVETGGWFILGCPLSQVSKPQLKGSIYRIRRTGAPRVEDPYGNKIDWQSAELETLAGLLEDPRPFVADRAVENLVTRGGEAVASLESALTGSAKADVRTRIVFALYRIGTPAALKAMRSGLEDTDLEVRVATARAAGLAKDPLAAPRLEEMVATDEPAAKRQAATALGQIGYERAIPALLEATGKTEDRFVRHALIYALISMNRPEAVVPALAHVDARVREAALIALDQMPSAPLLASQLTPFLNAADTSLQQTALWVASHHPEWAAPLIGFLENKLGATRFDATDKQLLGSVLTGYCNDPQMQNFMAGILRSGSEEKKLFVMGNMAECQAESFPQNWIDQLGAVLSSTGSAPLKIRAINLIRLRQIRSLDRNLIRLADHQNNPAALRVEAMGALLENEPTLSENRFNYLTGLLTSDQEAPLLHRVTAILTRAELSEPQQLYMAREVLPKVDHFMLPRLLPALEGSKNTEVGQSIAALLMETPSLDNFTEKSISELFAGFPSELDEEVKTLLEKLKAVQQERLQRLTDLESRIAGGSEERGRQLYFGKAICYTCHSIGDEGGDLGPDLTSIQHDRSVHDILEAVIYPSVSFVREYETYEITTAAEKYMGIIREQTPEAIILATGPGVNIRIPREDITQISNLEVSLMPPGLDQLLSKQEFADLMAFLIGADLVY